MLTVGSVALRAQMPVESYQNYRNGNFLDTDYICTEAEWELWSKYYTTNKGIVRKCIREGRKGIILYEGRPHKEFEIALPGSSAELILAYCSKHADQCAPGGYHCCAPLDVLYMLKMSHRYRKNSPHFLKTMKDIHLMRSMGAKIPDDLQEAYKLRMAETYTYSHPKLNVSSKEFFSNDGVNYIYEHDDIHDAIALLDKPAFRYYMTEGEVMTSKDKFFSVEESIRLLGVYEESCVLALERSQIPTDFNVAPDRSFMLALTRVCTSVTSGWFREYAWENFFKVVELYHRLGKDDYVKRFKEKQHKCRPYGGNDEAL